MGKRYSEEEIRILLGQSGVTFTEEEIQALMNGEAPIKVAFKADKVIEKHNYLMTKPLSREEALNNFVTISMFNQLNNAVVVMRHILLQTGILTEELMERVEHELIAKQLEHLCESCSMVYPVCNGQPKFVRELFIDVEGELGDKVYACPHHKPLTQEGTC